MLEPQAVRDKASTKSVTQESLETLRLTLVRSNAVVHFAVVVIGILLLFYVHELVHLLVARLLGFNAPIFGST